MDLEKAQNKMSKLGAEQEEELQILKSEKDRLRLELSVAENTFRDQMLKEKNRLQHLSEKEIQTLVESHVCYTNSLKSEIQKLYEISEIKTQEIQRLNHEIAGMKELYKDEIAFLKKEKHRIIIMAIKHSAYFKPLLKLLPALLNLVHNRAI